MNETSTTARSTGSGKRRGLERPGVDPLHRHDTRVVSEALRELAIADVDRVDPGRAPLEQDVREATGGSAHVNGDTAHGIHAERVERREQLVRAAADPLAATRDLDRDVDRHEVAALPVAARAVALAHPHLARKHERLGAGTCLREAALHEELVEAHASRRRGGHAPIVAQPAHRGRSPEPPGIAPRSALADGPRRDPELRDRLRHLLGEARARRAG